MNENLLKVKIIVLNSTT